jgi:RNA polymerase sigma factor (sigma-70 family)
MTTEPLTRLVRSLKQSLDAAELTALADAELLARFRATRDPAALEVIVHRHGPRVLAACRRVVRERADADDAFQATFVILLRQSPALRNVRALGPWLAGVAHRVSLQARRARERRERIEAKARVQSESTPDLSWRDACVVLHEELDRLPDAMRLPVVLCYLDGLSRDEAATQLRRTLSSVKKSLEKGREVLRKRLSRRGVTLSAGLLAAVAEPALANLPPSLTRAAVDSVVRPSAAVSALARTVGASSWLSAAGACLAASVLVVGVALGVSGDPKAEPPAKEMPAKKEMTGKAAPVKDPVVLAAVAGIPETFAYGGQVVDRLGLPVKGAKVWLCFPEGGSAPLRECGESDADGKFAFNVKHQDFPPETFRRPAIQWHTGTLLAVAPGYGVGWEQQRAGYRPEIKIQLPRDDVPVEGRVLDLEGKPVAGATIRVIGLCRPKAADLSSWHAELAKTKVSRRLMQEQLTSFDEYGLRHGQLNTIFPPVSSGADGRFTLKGLGRERVALVRIEGDSIETRDVFVMTRPGATVTAVQWPDENPEFALPRHTFYGCEFDHAAAPSRPIVGTVRDLDTGKPIAGAQVAVEHVAGNTLWDPLRAVAKTDRDGRFKLIGMPLKDGNHVVARGPSDEPYLGLVKQPKIPAGLGPIEVDFALKRGAWVTGACSIGKRSGRCKRRSIISRSRTIHT